MTMLDRMRRHRHWLKWSLALVVLSFIAFYIPNRNRNMAAASHDELASVNGETVTVSAYRRAYQQAVQMYRSAYGPNFNEQMLKQMGLEQQILRQLVEERAAIAEAKRLGLSVSDAEVAQRILSIPAFQENGVFAGEEVYARVLASQRPPLTKAEFEDNLRRSLLVDKLHATLTDWMTVSDADVTAEFTRRNEKARVELVVLSADKLRSEVTVGDQDLSAWFNTHKEDYRVGEKRRIKYLLIDVDALRAKAVVAPGDVEKYYRDNTQEFTTPEQVRASHILIKTEGKDDAAARAKAEDLLKQVHAGADFAALAKKSSEDEGSAKNGGDLDYFGRGRMAKEFEDAAFALQPGELSGVVKSPFGYHIIKLVDRKPAMTKSLTDVRQQITDRLAYERAQADAGKLAARVGGELKSPSDLDRIAAAEKLPLHTSGFFLRDEPVAGLGPVPEITDQAFTAKADAVSGPITTARGVVFFAVVGTEPSRLPQLAEVKDKVRDDVTRDKARQLTKTRAAALAGSLAAGDFGKAAKAAGLDVKSTELVSRGTAWPDVGISPALDQAVFAQHAGGVTAPVTTDAATVVAHVVEHQDVKPEDLATARDGLKQEMENDRRSRFFGAYMVKARDRMKIEVDQDVLKSLVG